MTKAEARRVAKYHAENEGCTPFRLKRYQFDPEVWRGHFEADLRVLTDRRKYDDGELEAIVQFIVGPDPHGYPEPSR